MGTVKQPSLPAKGALVSSDSSLLVSDLHHVVERAIREATWTVIVCPSQRVASKVKKFIGSVLPARSSSGGRTNVLPGGTRLSIASASEMVFVPENEPFVIALVAWGQAENEDFGGMARWRGRAARVLDFSTLKES